VLSPLQRLAEFISGPVSHTERLVSTIGGCVAIYAILLVSQFYLGSDGALLIIPSMGASAVLLFAVPHGPLSQPWNVFAGHLVSALVGVACFQQIPDLFLAAALAVGLAIGAMYYLRCIHPPGGATALAAVIGGDATHVLGYQFVLTPVLVNVLVILFVALLFNLPFDWRRYPVWLVRKREQEQPAPPADTSPHVKPLIEHADLVAALAVIDSFIDVSEEDLLRIYDIATGQARARSFPVERILRGHYYSNGGYEEDWSVRQVVDAAAHDNPDKDLVIYKVVAGRGLRESGVDTRQAFARWARYEVLQDGENWKHME
jgi:CBS domain-containing membrane protein